MWTIKETSEILKISKDEICKAIAKGHIQYAIIDEQITVSSDELKKWLEMYCEEK